jgi:[ribosomal protein S5]-alanine N-acetyltransferase
MSAIEQLELHTDRLALKVLDSSYADRVLGFFVRNRDFLREWNPTTTDEFYTAAFHAEKLANDLAWMREGWLLRLHLFAREDTAREHVVGTVSLNNIVRGAFQSCHLGYQIDEQAANQGLMTEALRRVIAYAFDQLKLHRIEANVMPRNIRSRRVVEKLGFAEEGLAKRYLRINGVWEDHIHYVILADD